MASPTPNGPSLIVLDDYLSTSTPLFAETLSNPSTYTILTNPIPASDLIPTLKTFSIISTMRERTPFPASLLAHLPNLKLLLTTGMRNRGIDLEACRKLGIVVCGTTGKGRSDRDLSAGEELELEGYDSTTQQTWALILGLVNNIARNDVSVKLGGWQTAMNANLAGKTLGLVGLGTLGSRAARIGQLAFGMKVICWSENLTQEKADEASAKAGLRKGSYQVVGKEELFRRSDVVSLHLVLGERTRGIAGATELGLMKRTAFLVNTSRGPLVDERALLEICRKGGIRGVGMDVFDVEPLAEDSEWRSTGWGKEGRSEVLLSPHVGYLEEDKMRKWYEEQAENVERWIAGKEVLNKMN
ncbi:MAG: hypothetical protein MMC33_000135 [Icmadophila ericetorum]|nr:hypothetical protein [Icmadophila ericetorum]